MRNAQRGWCVLVVSAVVACAGGAGWPAIVLGAPGEVIYLPWDTPLTPPWAAP